MRCPPAKRLAGRCARKLRRAAGPQEAAGGSSRCTAAPQPLQNGKKAKLRVPQAQDWNSFRPQWMQKVDCSPPRLQGLSQDGHIFFWNEAIAFS